MTPPPVYRNQVIRSRRRRQRIDFGYLFALSVAIPAFVLSREHALTAGQWVLLLVVSAIVAYWAAWILNRRLP